MTLICVDSNKNWCYAERLHYSSIKSDYKLVKVPDLWKSYDIHLFVTGVWKPNPGFWNKLHNFLMGVFHDY